MFRQQFYILLFLFLLQGCMEKRKTSEDNLSDDAPENVTTNPQKIRTQTNLLVKSVLDDFDQNGSTDKLELGVQATKNEQGKIVWDDSQIWYVFIQRNGQKDRDTIYAQSIQLGKLQVLRHVEKKFIILQEDAPYQNKSYRIDFNKKIELIPVKDSLLENSIILLDFTEK